jgi:hypothetical protein
MQSSSRRVRVKRSAIDISYSRAAVHSARCCVTNRCRLLHANHDGLIQAYNISSIAQQLGSDPSERHDYAPLVLQLRPQ